MVREPVSRLLSAINMATGHAPEFHDVPCENRTLQVYEDFVERHHHVGGGPMKFFITWQPYAGVFKVASIEEVAPKLAYLEENLILGVTEHLDGYLELLTRLFRLDERANAAYGGQQQIDAEGYGHVAKPYCSASHVSPDVVAGLAAHMEIDTAIYEGFKEVFYRQQALAPEELPRHWTTEETCKKHR
mmetsp:Transcript_794/g.3154  ORF Transcript_794/g.3154 Transcript_794/m.3154 type:complete len:188 (-) Transcript_794:228-791(-)